MTTTQTTTRLHLPLRDRARAWLSQRDPLAVLAVCVLPLIGLLMAGAIWRSQRPVESVAPPTLAPIMIIATARAEQLPTAVPAPDRQLKEELDALRARVAELEAREATAPPPQVIYAQAPDVAASDPAEAAQIPADPAYAVDSAPVVPIAPLAPNQPPAVAQPTVAPASAPDATPSLEQALARTRASLQQPPSDRWREEHCFGDQCVP